MKTILRLKRLMGVGIAVWVGGTATPVHAQLGIVTSAVGAGQIIRADGSETACAIGTSVDVGDKITTSQNGYAMVFFVAGLGASDIVFDGVIVVDVDQGTQIEIRRGEGRPAPIDVHVLKGRVRAFFDAGEHKDYILLSTPLGQMKVTGSIIYATHDESDSPGSVFGSFDSDCRVTLEDGAAFDISRYQKVVVSEKAAPAIVGITTADLDSWKSFPDLGLAAALSSSSQVQIAYAGRSWVGEYVTSEERLEDVAAERNNNIPSQSPELVSSTTANVTRTQVTTPRQNQPVLRSVSVGRSVGGDNGGFGRGTDSHSNLPSIQK